MTPTPLLEAGPLVQAYAAAAFAALALGAARFAPAKGTLRHRIVGTA